MLMLLNEEISEEEFINLKNTINNSLIILSKSIKENKPYVVHNHKNTILLLQRIYNNSMIEYNSSEENRNKYQKYYDELLNSLTKYSKLIEIYNFKFPNNKIQSLKQAFKDSFDNTMENKFDKKKIDNILKSIKTDFIN